MSSFGVGWAMNSFGSKQSNQIILVISFNLGFNKNITRLDSPEAEDLDLSQMTIKSNEELLKDFEIVHELSIPKIPRYPSLVPKFERRNKFLF